MSKASPVVSAKFYLSRLQSDQIYDLLEVAGDRRATAERFYDWLRCEVEGEMARRSTFASGVPQEAAPLDCSSMALWEPEDLAAALKASVGLSEGVADFELNRMFTEILLAVTGIVCYRLTRRP